MQEVGPQLGGGQQIEVDAGLGGRELIVARRRTLAGLLAAVIAAFMCGSVAAAEKHGHAHVVKKLDHVVAVVKKLGIPGGVIGVSGGPAGNFERAFGQASPGQKMRLNDHFRIASVTKTFTATVILELVDRHKLRLNQPIHRWEPRVPNARRITIRMLLNMTSGIWDEGGPGSLLSAWVGKHCHLTKPSPRCSKYWKPQQLVDLAIKQGPEYPPGVYNYTDTGYVMLGIIAQKVTHKSMAWLLQHLIFDPLHMRHTSFPTRSLSMPRPAAAGHLPVLNKARTEVLRYVHGPLVSPSLLFSAGGIISTLGDLQIWARGLGRGTLLKSSTQRQRLQLVATAGALTPLKGTGVTYGLGAGYGLGVLGVGGLLGHNGAYSVPGFTTELWYAPQARASVVVLLNSISMCSPGGFLSDAVATSLAELAFPSSLQRLPLPSVVSPVVCPAVNH